MGWVGNSVGYDVRPHIIPNRAADPTHSTVEWSLDLSGQGQAASQLGGVIVHASDFSDFDLDSSRRIEFPERNSSPYDHSSTR